MQKSYPKIILDRFFYQKNIDFDSFSQKIMKIHQNWKIALFLVACCQKPWKSAKNWIWQIVMFIV